MQNNIEAMNEVITKLEKEIKESFLIDFNKDNFEIELGFFDDSSSLEFKGVYSSFKENLMSIVSTATMPEIMAIGKANLEIFNRILTQERILSLKIDDENTLEDKKNIEKQKERGLRAYQKAKDRFFAERKEEEGKNEFTLITLNFLNDLSDDTSFKSASRNLINQCTLSVWTVFGVFCRDCFILLLNKKSELVEKLSEVPELKQKFNLKTLPVQKLVEFNYDLSNHMGNVLIDNFEFSNIETIRSVYKCIFTSENLRAKLEINDLWLLFKRRNLLVHKSGVVDKQYLESTSDNLPLHSKLVIKPEEFLKYLELIVDVAKNIKKEIENYCA
jgi:hypothetical protein